MARSHHSANHLATRTDGSSSPKRRRPTAVMALLLVAAALAGEWAELHPEALRGPSPAETLPTFATDHATPNHSLHIERVARVDEDSCVGCPGCLPQQRRLALGAVSPPVVGIEPQASDVAIEAVGDLGMDARRLKPSRAPPYA